MSKLKWLLIPMLSLIAACQSTTAPIDTSCAWVKPITTTAQDRACLSHATKVQIAIHNELYDKRCDQ